jgi:hypothetical protein
MIRPVFTANPNMTLGVADKLRLAPFPNPTTGTFSISGLYESLTIYTAQGHLAFTDTRRPMHDISFLPDGVYLLTVRLRGGESITYKFLKY